MFLLIPITLILLSWPVSDAADGVIEPVDQPGDRFNPQIQAAPAGPYYEVNQ